MMLSTHIYARAVENSEKVLGRALSKIFVEQFRDIWTEHWLWTGARAGSPKSRLGVLVVNGKLKLAKAVLYEQMQEIDDYLVPFDTEHDELHRICDVPGCVRPQHHMPYRPRTGAKRRRGVRHERYRARAYCMACKEKRPCNCTYTDIKAAQSKMFWRPDTIDLDSDQVSDSVRAAPKGD